MCIREDPMAFAPSASWNSRSITHLANYPSPSLPMIFSDESQKKRDFAGLQAADHYAWEQASFLTKYAYSSATKPGPILELVLHAIPKLHLEPTTATLIRLCQAKGIDPRTGVKHGK